MSTSGKRLAQNTVGGAASVRQLPSTTNTYREVPAESQKPVLQFVKPLRGSYDSKTTMETVRVERLMLKRAMIATGTTSSSARRLRPRRQERRGRAVALTMVVVVGLSLSGCISTGFTYISHRSRDATILGFKLPNKWATFDTQQVLESTNGPISSAEAKNIADGEWEEAFSASPHPTADFFATAEHSSYPVGFAEARQLNSQERDGFNFATLRSEILGADPLGGTSPDPYNVTAYTEFARPSDGLRGSSLTTNIKLASGATATLSQIVEVDANTNWLFAITVACTAACWGPNNGVIHQILKSWSVKGTK